MEELISRAVKGMEANGFTVARVQTGQEACNYLLSHIQPGTTVGVGGSVTVREIGAVEALTQQGCEVFTHSGAPADKVAAIRRSARDADAYLTSANAVTRTGKLVLIDGAGNRVGAICDGPKDVYFIISESKIVDGDINAAIARIKKVACPLNARRLGLNTHCAATGICKPDECEQSICRLTLVVDRTPRERHVTVILVEEALGY